MYNQRVGTAMGHIFAPPYACLVIGYLEEDKLFKDELYMHFEAQDIEIIQSQYKRSMDDGSTLLPKTIERDKFLSCLNYLHPDIVFTVEPATFFYLFFKFYFMLLISQGRYNPRRTNLL